MELTTQVVRQLSSAKHPDLLVGTDQFDDAGVFRINETQAIVQTVDFFPPLVDDPYTFGQIAAANSLSDIYAMGGKPITALNIVGFPDKELPGDVLVEILNGGSERAREAGTAIVGGHSVRDSEVKYGLAVTGLIDPNRIITNGGAQPGDKLVLTKPIGSGVLTSAVKVGKLPVEELQQAIDVMIELNRGGAEAMLSVDTHAATDITGFGLMGHAFEMASASNVTLEMDASAVPLLDRTLEFASQGVVTRAYKGTLAHLGDQLDVGDVDQHLVNVLADAQTSGGLLIAVSAQDANELVTALNNAKTACAALIGEVVSRGASVITLRN